LSTTRRTERSATFSGKHEEARRKNRVGAWRRLAPRLLPEHEDPRDSGRSCSAGGSAGIGKREGFPLREKLVQVRARCSLPSPPANPRRKRKMMSSKAELRFGSQPSVFEHRNHIGAVIVLPSVHDDCIAPGRSSANLRTAGTDGSRDIFVGHAVS